jgi:exopolyphosphatase/guanosine-5'-triphosphate,3'-diphosphate pyrophosphatase
VGLAEESSGVAARVAIVDMGTNSTRLLVADVNDGSVTELERRSTVTRLGRGVDTSSQLATDAIEEVCGTVAEYVGLYTALDPDRVIAIATSAVRDATNGGAFIGELRERFALDATVLSGAEEARLTYLGASTGREHGEGTLVVDIGGGSTELVLGSGTEVSFYASLQAGTVRHTERHLKHDPPQAEELEAMATDIQHLLDAALEGEALPRARHGIAVAGTPTSLAAIDLALDPYDAEHVHGHVLSLDSIQRMLSELAAKPLAERLEVTGLQAGRAPTIVAGVVILVAVMRAFGLGAVEASEHDILYGAALEAAGAVPTEAI